MAQSVLCHQSGIMAHSCLVEVKRHRKTRGTNALSLSIDRYLDNSDWEYSPNATHDAEYPRLIWCWRNNLRDYLNADAFKLKWRWRKNVPRIKQQASGIEWAENKEEEKKTVMVIFLLSLHTQCARNSFLFEISVELAITNFFSCGTTCSLTHGYTVSGDDMGRKRDYHRKWHLVEVKCLRFILSCSLLLSQKMPFFLCLPFQLRTFCPLE